MPEWFLLFLYVHDALFAFFDLRALVLDEDTVAVYCLCVRYKFNFLNRPSYDLVLSLVSSISIIITPSSL